jgi:hypothetical protein
MDILGGGGAGRNGVLLVFMDSTGFLSGDDLGLTGEAANGFSPRLLLLGEKEDKLGFSSDVGAKRLYIDEAAFGLLKVGGGMFSFSV